MSKLLVPLVYNYIVLSTIVMHRDIVFFPQNAIISFNGHWKTGLSLELSISSLLSVVPRDALSYSRERVAYLVFSGHRIITRWPRSKRVFWPCGVILWRYGMAQNEFHWSKQFLETLRSLRSVVYYYFSLPSIVGNRDQESSRRISSLTSVRRPGYSG